MIVRDKADALFFVKIFREVFFNVTYDTHFCVAFVNKERKWCRPIEHGQLYGYLFRLVLPMM